MLKKLFVSLMFVVSASSVFATSFNLPNDLEILTKRGSVAAVELLEGDEVIIINDHKELTAVVSELSIDDNVVSFDVKNLKEIKKSSTTGNYRIGKFAKIALPMAISASMIPGASGGIFGCASSAVFCESGCVAAIAGGCGTAFGTGAIGWLALVCAPCAAAIGTICAPMVGAVTQQACVAGCVAAVCGPWSP